MSPAAPTPLAGSNPSEIPNRSAPVSPAPPTPLAPWEALYGYTVQRYTHPPVPLVWHTEQDCVRDQQFTARDPDTHGISPVTRYVPEERVEAAVRSFWQMACLLLAREATTPEQLLAWADLP